MAEKKGSSSKKATTKRPSVNGTDYDRWSAGAGTFGKPGTPIPSYLTKGLHKGTKGK